MFRWILPALLSGLIALFVFLPLGWVAGFFLPDDVKDIAPDLSFRGTVWNGTASGVPVFDTVNVKTSLIPRKAVVEAGKGKNYLFAEVTPETAKDVDLRVDFENFPLKDGRLQGLRGELIASLTELTFNAEGCLSAEGFLRTDVLQRNGGSIQWTGPELEGPITCEAGALVAAMTGRDNEQSIQADIRMAPDGVYRTDISVQTVRQEADVVLPIFGFTRQGGSFMLTEQGRWR